MSREIDVLVAEKVMGIDLGAMFCTDGNEPQPCLYGIEYKDGECLTIDEFGDKKRCEHLKSTRELGVLPYSTDIAAAWEVFTKYGYQGYVKYTGPDWVCSICIDTESGIGKWYHAKAETAPLAICSAALAAKGVSV